MSRAFGVVIVLAVVIGGFVVWQRANNPVELNGNVPVANDGRVERLFERENLQTNTAKTLIPLDEILGGGPGKDGIPALFDPEFGSIADTSPLITDDTRGVFVEVSGDKRFYPYNILVWHEIVNDTVGGQELAITFCPLCGSAIVFEREQEDGTVLSFGVSGKLYESNLLMYDDATESLWSQAQGRAVVGDLVGTQLAYAPFQLLTFGEVTEKHPDAKVQSVVTGHRRDYALYPYGDYETTERLVFPTSVQDKRFPAKQIMYVVPYGDESVAVHLEQLQGLRSATVSTKMGDIIVEFRDGEVFAQPSGENRVLPGYYEMWFSWATHHQQDGIVWSG